MAKFCNSHLKLKSNERVYFGDLDNASFTYDGSDLVVDVPIRGEQAVQYYHLVRYDQLTTASGYLQNQIDGINNQIDWQDSVLTISGAPPASPNDGDRYLIDSPASGAWTGQEDYIAEWSTVSGGWVYTAPNPGMATYVEDQEVVYLYDGTQWEPWGVTIDHGNLLGLLDDDHPQYVPTDGSRGFTSTVSGIDPTQDYHLATKWYVDDAIATATGTLTGDHGDLNGLLDDDHPQYVPTDASRGFTNTVSGIDPTADYHLATKYYVDQQFTTLSGNRKWGRITVISGAYSQAVTFDNAFPDDDYTLVATLTNEVDSPPCIYSTIQGVKTSSGFTTHFSGEIENGNFILEWIAEYSQQS